MLREITVQNLAVIGEARLEFGGRLTAITGETGAGKSLVVDAIGLALGDRADSGLIGTGATRCVVSAVFEANVSAESLAEAGLDAEEGLLLARELSDGRSQCRINGRPVTSSMARGIGEQLVDLHGQHEHQTLLRPSAHRDLLDSWIGDEAWTFRRKLESLTVELRRATDRLGELDDRSRERERLIDLYRFEHKEIEQAELRAGEEEELDGEIRRMQNAEKLAQEVTAALEAVSHSERSATDGLSMALCAAERGAVYDGELSDVVESLNTALATAQDAANTLVAYRDALEFDPERLQIVADRLDVIRRLKRKYGATVAEVLAYGEQVAEQLAALEGGEEARAELGERIAELQGEVGAVAAALTDLRRRAAERFSQDVLSELRELAMEHAAFEVLLVPKDPDATGAETVEYQFSANPGHPPRALSKTASGGELSRLMLAIRCVFAGASPAATVVFDEVDAGLGGQTAGVVGRKLKELSRHSQTIVITHLPQIAGQADEHFHVRKEVVGGETRVSVERLEGERRVQELARMLGGEVAASVALDHARELLAIAGEQTQ